MHKNKKKIATAAALLLSALFFSLTTLRFDLEGKAEWSIAEGKNKITKWQKRLQNLQVPSYLWAKYLPKITRQEYRKTLKKYNTLSRSVSPKYFLHQNITTTIFWIGEGASSENGYIANDTSAWDENWMNHFGGKDDPKNRHGYFPVAFTPQENPFYFALPYNDFENGKRRSDAQTLIPWAKEKNWLPLESMCKNRWIKIIKNGKVAYAQWEDVGPFSEYDPAYVFGNSTPRNQKNNQAGLDVSPAVRDYLGLSDVDKCDWQFVDPQEVPEGPWKQIITFSQIYWK